MSFLRRLLSSQVINALLAFLVATPLVLSVLWFAQSKSDLARVLERQKQEQVAADARIRSAITEIETLIRRELSRALASHDKEGAAEHARLLQEIEKLLARSPIIVVRRGQTTIIQRRRIEERPGGRPGGRRSW